MKETLIFAGMNCYPKGGMDDFYSYGSDLESDISFLETSQLEYEWYQIAEFILSLQSGISIKILAEGVTQNFHSSDRSRRTIEWEIK